MVLCLCALYCDSLRWQVDTIRYSAQFNKSHDNGDMFDVRVCDVRDTRHWYCNDVRTKTLSQPLQCTSANTFIDSIYFFHLFVFLLLLLLLRSTISFFPTHKQVWLLSMFNSHKIGSIFGIILLFFFFLHFFFFSNHLNGFLCHTKIEDVWDDLTCAVCVCCSILLVLLVKQTGKYGRAALAGVFNFGRMQTHNHQ